MKIETLDDWNMILGGCGCCLMPECPVPAKGCESITTETICGWGMPNCESVTAADQCRRFSTKASSYTLDAAGLVDSGNTRSDLIYNANTTNTKTFDLNCGLISETGSRHFGYTEVIDNYNEDTQAWEHYTTINSSEDSTWVPCVGTYWITFNPEVQPNESGPSESPVCKYLDHNLEVCTYTRASDLVFTLTKPAEGLAIPGTTVETVTFSDEIILADLLIGKTFEDDTNGSFCGSSNNCISLTWARFRWTIPDTFEGTYFKITWDVVFFPTTGDPSPVTTDATWEWTGPGDPGIPDSWKSGWYEIPVPTDPGENRVVNVRFECYKSAKFGTIPQVTGEAWEPPPPP